MQGVVLHTCNPNAGDIEAGLQANGTFKDSLGYSMRLFFFLPQASPISPIGSLPLRPCLQLYLL